MNDKSPVLARKEVLLIFLMGLGVYFNSLKVNFIWDDIALILENPLIRSFSNITKIFSANLSSYQDVFYRPIQNLTYILDFSLYKFYSRGYHFTNNLLHISAVLLFAWMLCLLTRNRKIAFSASLLYLVSPLWVESVTYISGRADVLMAIFLLLSFIFYLKEKVLFPVLFYWLALLSKEASLAFPLLILLHIILFKKIRFSKAVYLLCIFLGSSAAYLVLRSKVIGSFNLMAGGDYSLYIRLLYFIKAVPKYIGLIFLPLNQNMSYTVNLAGSFFEKEVLFSAGFLVVLFSAFIYFLKKEKIVSFFLGWFFLALIPYSGIFPVNAFFSEHFIYFAGMGIFAVFAIFLQKIKSRFVSNLIICIYLFSFSLATVKYNFVWQDAVKFYQRIIKLSSGSFTAYNNLGVIYFNRGEIEEARKLYTKSLEINPDFTQAKLNLARYYYFKKDYARAIGLAKGVLDKDSGNFLALNYLGSFCLADGKPEEARNYYLKAIKANPGFGSFKSDLYQFYKVVGKEKEAKEILREIELSDKYVLASICFEEARILWGKNKLVEALYQIDKAIETGFAESRFYNLKGCILKKKGDYLQALDSFKKALVLDASDYSVYNNLGSLFAVAGDFKRAEGYFKKAISLNSAYQEANLNLELLRQQKNQKIRDRH